jgi:hypothetical protein
MALFMSNAMPSYANSVYISDMFLAANSTHIFLLRTIRDDLGVDTASAIDAILVGRSLALDEPDSVWPIRRTINYPPDLPRQDVNVTIRKRVNPFDILIKQGAWPGLNNWAEVSTTMEIKNTTLEFTSRMLKSPLKVTIKDAIDQLRNSNTAVRKILPLYTNGKSAEADAYTLNEKTFAKECRLISSMILRSQNGNNGPILAEFYCLEKTGAYRNARLMLLVSHSD